MRAVSAPVSKQELISRILEARAETDRLFSLLHPDALYDRPIPERHRIVFYVGHLEAFDWNLFKDSLDLKSFSPEYDRLFAFGIDPVDGGLPTDVPSDWPNPGEVQAYRDRLRITLDRRFEECTELDETLLNIAIEHRLMHAETLEYMFHQLPLNRKLNPDHEALVARGPVTQQMIDIPAGTATLGMNRESGVFGWDNEFQEHSMDVPGFSVDRYKVTNREYLRFVEAGGYDKADLWSAADWEWRTTAGISHPVFWVPSAEGWRYRAMFDELALCLDSPVFVSHAEASAYAKWAGKRLPTEAEWHRYSVGAKLPSETRKLWNPPPVGCSPETRSSYGIEDVLGSAWEWTATQFYPFNGFEIVPAYPGYSANFFDGKHYVMKGGSTRTDACMLRPTFRNWFQAHYQYVYAGFRCVSSVPAESTLPARL